ncbi:hypothetical protein PMI15_02597 [Polaromonas sp. CF318]|uniref:hypothetical protein n=1 Tax=Polaromonas sp. CF318 TaxID=1144318 RepID=UPI00027108C5|nr:hypothetical protein [Polaromonas sp. CF318]EJL83584.1 hypothetical protein PMI15_02597 [Polaromonas sp. CF318]
MKIVSSLFSLSRLSRLSRRTALAAAVLGATALTGCYVVPVQPNHPPVTSTVYVTPAVPASTTFAARLYPANDLARGYGMVGAVVTNDMNGRGTFTTNINGESFTGEATRIAGSSTREGVANGSGSRGNYISCRYQMNSSTLGTGQCRLSNGAEFTMHVGG